MEILLSCLTLFLLSIGASKLLSVVIAKKTIKQVRADNEKNDNKHSVFLKKYKQVDVDRWSTTNKLVGLALALGFLLVSAESFTKKKSIAIDQAAIVPFDTLTLYVDIDNLPPPPPKTTVPPPPIPPPPIIPPEIIEVPDVIEKPDIIETPEPEDIKMPMPPLPSVQRALEKPPVALKPPPAPKPKENNELENKIYDFVEVDPSFPGGFDELRKQIGKNYHIPKQFSGTATITTRFVVQADGSIGEIRILKGVDDCDACNEEAIKAIRKVREKFNAGRQAGKPVNVWFTLPIVLQKR